MQKFEQISNELDKLIVEWDPRLRELEPQVRDQKTNRQNRTIRQIVGHMADSASNNLHRVIHLQYQSSPFNFPNYATHGNNDRWIAIQHYQEEDWDLLMDLWKATNRHFAWVIRFLAPDKLNRIWLAGDGAEVTLEDMVVDFPRHFKLHIREIMELMDS